MLNLTALLSRTYDWSLCACASFVYLRVPYFPGFLSLDVAFKTSLRIPAKTSPNLNHTDVADLVLCRYVYLQEPIWVVQTNPFDKATYTAFAVQRPILGIYLNVGSILIAIAVLFLWLVVTYLTKSCLHFQCIVLLTPCLWAITGSSFFRTDCFHSSAKTPLQCWWKHVSRIWDGWTCL